MTALMKKFKNMSIQEVGVVVTLWACIWNVPYGLGQGLAILTEFCCFPGKWWVSNFITP
jgi:hypothetical protein